MDPNPTWLEWLWRVVGWVLFPLVAAARLRDLAWDRRCREAAYIHRTHNYLWYPSADALAQTSHFFIATTIVLALALAGQPWWAQAAGVLAWAGPKEFIFDVYGPEKDSWADSAWDFLWYCAGGAVAVLAVLTL